MVVYVSDAGQDGATPQVWLQQVGGAAVQLTTSMRECEEPTFSADDTRVIFSAAADSTRHVYEMPALGGQPRVLKRAARNGRFSPDGKWLVYLAIDSPDAVRLVSGDGKERVLATGLVDISSATWSDDSRHLLVVGHPDPSADRDCWIVPVDGGAPVDTRRAAAGATAGPGRHLDGDRLDGRFDLLHGGRTARHPRVAATRLADDVRAQWPAGAHDAGGRVRVLPDGVSPATGLRRCAHRYEHVVGRHRRKHRQGRGRSSTL